MQLVSFLTHEKTRDVQREFGTPVFVYDQATLEAQARQALAFPHAFGLTVRYAMKAMPTAAVLRIFSDLGLHIDASSGFEAGRALRAGVPADTIQITAQQFPDNLEELVDAGVGFTACSIHQLRQFGQLFPGADVCVRINPGLGSGHSNRTNTGGPAASFGVWWENLDGLFAVQQEFGLRITHMHTHIGSGGDPDVWERCAALSLGIAAQLPDVHTLCLGGGFKVARMPGETAADVSAIGERIAASFEAFHREHGRKLHCEIEPGTFLVANAGALVAAVIDVVDTGQDGYRFIKTDSGMTEILRPSLYAAQHPIAVVPRDPDDTRGESEYVVVGHCCESGDILTPKPGDHEGLGPRVLTDAQAGDAIVIGGAGGYCAAMSAKNYNSFPEAPEVLLTPDGRFRLIRKRQTLDQMTENEILPEA